MEKVRLLVAQSGFDENGGYSDDSLDNEVLFEDKYYPNDKKVAKLIEKYRLWLEQGCRCLYTGKVISLSELFGGNAFDVEHTIPRSLSFDNSQANLTICDAYYNRSIKKQLLPTELPNYSETVVLNGTEYSAIEPRLKRWKEKVEKLRSNVNFWAGQSKKAQDKERKDNCIRQRHLWQLELNYWQDKLNRFTVKEVTKGFRNSQLVDTGIITRHAVEYLKSVFSRVEVQKGSVTADFRKILGVQSLNEKKDRTLHSHHAIDAAVLTLVPEPAKRDRMLKLFYLQEENKKLGQDYSVETRDLNHEIKDCKISGNVTDLSAMIERNIIVNHRTIDRTLIPARKAIRKRGKEVLFRSSDGELSKRFSAGDSIRGNLHKETYYGAILLPDKFESTNKGPLEYEKDKDGNFLNYWMVVRVSLDDKEKIKKMEDLDTIVDPKVRSVVKNAVRQRMASGISFAVALKSAVSEGIWLLDKDGNEIKYDKNGRNLSPIRHVRCRAKSGRGYLSFEKSLPIHSLISESEKSMVNLTSRDYKKYSYAQNDSNYLFLLYEAIVKGVVKRKSRILNYFDIAQYNKSRKEMGLTPLHDTNELFQENYYSILKEKKLEYKLSAILKVGDRILLWKETPEELTRLDAEKISERLFVIEKFNNMGSDFLYYRHHLDASNNDDLLKSTAQNANFLFEHRDFDIDELGNIIFKDND